MVDVLLSHLYCTAITIFSLLRLFFFSHPNSVMPKIEGKLGGLGQHGTVDDTAGRTIQLYWGIICNLHSVHQGNSEQSGNGL